MEDISVKYENTIPDFENSLRAAFFKIEELRKKGEIWMEQEKIDNRIEQLKYIFENVNS